MSQKDSIGEPETLPLNPPSGRARDALLAAKTRMRPSEARVADAILGDMSAVQWMTVNELASLASVSEPTVMRFCRAVGVKGFRDFKVWLTRSLATDVSRVHHRISGPVEPAEVVKRVLDASREELDTVADTLDPAVLEAAARWIINSKRVAIFATGSSNVAALDIFQHLNRYGLPVSHTPDSHIQTQTAATLTSEDVAIIVSFTGGTKDNLRAAEIAQNSGARTVAVTRSNSELAHAVDLIVNVDPIENTYLFSPMSARIAQLAVCDALCTTVALSLGSFAEENLKQAKNSLKEIWVES